MRSIDNFKDYFKNFRQYRAIKTGTIFHIAWKNIASKKLRSFLTVFGVVIGITAIFFLLSFGLGIQSLVTKEVVGDNSLKAIDVNSPNSKILKLDEEAVNTMRQFPHVVRVGVQYTFPGILSVDGGEIDSVVYGINKDYQDLSSLDIVEGRLLSENDTKSIIVNKSALKSVGIAEDESGLNKEIELAIPLEGTGSDQNSITGKFKVVGVIESGSGGEVFIPSALFDVAGVDVYDQAKVVIDEVEYVETARKQIESLGFQTSSLTDTLTEINKVFKFFNLILISFGSIGMIVAVLGMFNTLTISLLERTREIGLMMALGARRSDMRKLFIFEAVLISVTGAIVGILFAILGGKLVNLYINNGAKGRGVTQSFDLFSYPLWAIGAIVGFTLVVGLLVVYFPARRAESINPIDALRRE